MTATTETKYRVMRIEFVDPIEFHRQPYTVQRMADQLAGLQISLDVAAIIASTQEPMDFSAFANRLRVARNVNQVKPDFELSSVSYNSPLWLTLIGATSSAISVSYSFVRMYSKFLDARKKRSDLKVHELANEQLMDDMRFDHAQKRILHNLMHHQAMPAGVGSSEEQAIGDVAYAIRETTYILRRISRIDIDEG